MKIKKGDEVVVIAGKDRGVKGKVIAADPITNKVVVEGVNRVKKHNRIGANARGAKTGGIETVEAAISASNHPLGSPGPRRRARSQRRMSGSQIQGRTKSASPPQTAKGAKSWKRRPSARLP